MTRMRAARMPWRHTRLAATVTIIISLLFALDELALADDEDHISVSADNSYWYDWGFYGRYPHVTYESFGAASPRTNIVRTDPRCSEKYIFIEPRGDAVETPGPVILDNEGNLVWMETSFGDVMDLQVQSYQGEDYLTFWKGDFNSTFGQGIYYMVNSSYEVSKTVKPTGGHLGDLHEFHITEAGTALMTIYQEKPCNDLSGLGIAGGGWIFDSLFQEVDIATGELVFEWRASEHFAIGETNAPIQDKGRSEETAFDFFHINSVDKDAQGNYLISSRYMCAVVCISPAGGVLWQLGGAGNDFEDLSDGAATSFCWNHYARWHPQQPQGQNGSTTTLTLFDNSAYDHIDAAEHSSGLHIALDLDAMTATLVQAYVSPQHHLAISQGSVQPLPEASTVLVGWGHTPAFTEFDAATGEPLCETHFGATNFADWAWVKSYRTFKFSWRGMPRLAGPDVAVRPRQAAVYVSWNGATEVDHWVLMSSSDNNEVGDNEAMWVEHQTVRKTSFETRMAIPSDAKAYLRLVALGASGAVLGTSRPVSRHEDTVVEPLWAPERHVTVPEFLIFGLCGVAVAVVAGLAWCFRLTLRGWGRRALRKWLSVSYYKYEALRTR